MRISIVGGSGHWDMVSHGLAELPDAMLCAVAPGRPDEEITGLVNDPVIAHYSPVRYADYREMLARERPDVVCVNPYYHLHAEVTLAALRHGAHVFSEKPLALDLPSLSGIETAQRETGLQIGMMLSFRGDGRFHAARRLVQAGAIGQPLAGYAQKSYKLGTRPPMYNRRETFGGIIPWVGIHAIDWFRWVSGIDYAAVTAYHRNCHAPQHPGMEDVAGCLFELSNGGSAVMSFDYLRPASAETHGDDRLRLVGTEGCLDIGVHEATITDTHGTRRMEPEVPTYGLFADFLLAITRAGHDCIVPTSEAIDITRIALLAREAADTGRRVLLAATSTP